MHLPIFEEEIQQKKSVTHEALEESTRFHQKLLQESIKTDQLWVIPLDLLWQGWGQKWESEKKLESYSMDIGQLNIEGSQ